MDPFRTRPRFSTAMKYPQNLDKYTLAASTFGILERWSPSSNTRADTLRQPTTRKLRLKKTPITPSKLPHYIYADIEVMINQIRDPEHMLCDTNNNKKDSINDYLDNSWYEGSSRIIIVGFLPQDADEVRIMEQYVEQVGNNFHLT